MGAHFVVKSTRMFFSLDAGYNLTLPLLLRVSLLQPEPSLQLPKLSQVRLVRPANAQLFSYVCPAEHTLPFPAPTGLRVVSSAFRVSVHPFPPQLCVHTAPVRHSVSTKGNLPVLTSRKKMQECFLPPSHSFIKTRKPRVCVLN